MDQAEAFSILRDTLVLALELSLPLLLAGLVVGLIVNVFQAVTQLSDATLSFVPKILAVFLSMAVFGPWMAHQIMKFAVDMLTHGVGSTP
ncbi:MAG TPA: flagellar biosynthesis protein FliQ [Chloroflexota bacterium]|nr:flagellar biosynthesis protein FliQ [Chloroflexota bacterium]